VINVKYRSLRNSPLGEFLTSVFNVTEKLKAGRVFLLLILTVV
jgi:hypothetical protein